MRPDSWVLATAVLMQNRNSFNLSGVTASVSGIGSPNPQITITMPSGAQVPSAIIPVTGLTSTGSEIYGGQNISHITMTPGRLSRCRYDKIRARLEIRAAVAVWVTGNLPGTSPRSGKSAERDHLVRVSHPRLL
jgi:hypothetical protein